ncbi:MAG: type II toxin-antitoxin system prevent-host-death family antitoxin [candidate division NC10 bacterium]|nr:type II toxin-antitoxin system prevent-host-death family antitoxin [candidate division NC10 bacterium]
MERAVGIRKLRDELTRHLGRVRRGGRIVITDRGQPVAVILPLADRSDGLGERLRAVLTGGHVTPAERRFPARVPVVRGRGRELSELVREGRR